MRGLAAPSKLKDSNRVPATLATVTAMVDLPAPELPTQLNAVSVSQVVTEHGPAGIRTESVESSGENCSPRMEIGMPSDPAALSTMTLDTIGAVNRAMLSEPAQTPHRANDDGDSPDQHPDHCRLFCF